MTKEDLLRLLRQKVPHPATPREILRVLKIPREERAGLKRNLRGLVSDGALIQIKGDRYGLPDRMDLVVGKLDGHPSGFGFVAPEKPVDGLTRDIYVPEHAMQEAMHGDRVVARIERYREDGRAEGRIVQVLERAASTVVGRYEVDRSGLGFVAPFDKRLTTDIQIPRTETRDAEPGQMVTVEVTRWPTPTRGPAGRIVEVLGDINDPGVDTEIILRKHGIPDEHGADAIAEARRIGTAVRDKDIAGRTDFRDRKVVTIDGEHARDFDDAISIEKLKNGNYWLGVHIADVAHYVREGGPLDEEAFERGTSVYFPERAVHMFPSDLATGLCSLKPDVDRLVQSCLMEVTPRGDVLRYEMHDGVIRSDARMTYTAVNAILTEKDPETIATYRELVPMFELMGELFEVLNARRYRRGSVDFDLPEAQVILNEAGLHHGHRRVRAQRRAPADRRVHAACERDRGSTPREQQHAGALSHPRAARSAQGAAVRGVHLGVRIHVGRAGKRRRQAEALPEAGREDQRQSRRAPDRLPDAAHHAEGALRCDECRALRPRRADLYAFHVADPPLSRSCRASVAA